MSASSLPSKEQEENVSVSILEQADAIMRPDRAEGGRMQSYFVGCALSFISDIAIREV